MRCYHCGAELSEHDFCTSCGADVGLYKQILHASNRYYNDGLEKAQVRDLSGAIRSLRQSLKLNKENIEARNLLGLIYFEMGETVAALSEWVISKNLRPEKNIADSYIDTIQANASELDSLNQSARKYNQAYRYCLQGSKDLAIIQLKKVLSVNPKYLRAHQLLALLYMDGEQWERARRELRRCQAIDRNNTLTLRYMHEVDSVLSPGDERRQPEADWGGEDAVRYQSDNEVIIQPTNVKETGHGRVTSLAGVIIGLAIGLAVMYFLVVPQRVETVRSEWSAKVTELGAQIDSKNTSILDLESQISTLQEEKDELEQELESYVGEGGTLSVFDDLLAVASQYLETGEALAAGTGLEEINTQVDVTQTSEAFQQLYGTILTLIGPEMSAYYYEAGETAADENDLETAITSLEMAVYYDAENTDAWYLLGDVYREYGDTENAVAAYEQVVALADGTQAARRASQYIEALTEE